MYALEIFWYTKIYKKKENAHYSLFYLPGMCVCVCVCVCVYWYSLSSFSHLNLKFFFWISVNIILIELSYIIKYSLIINNF